MVGLVGLALAFTHSFLAKMGLGVQDRGAGG